MRARRRFTVAEFPVDACTFMHPPHTEHITKYINAVWRPKSALWYMTPSLPSLLLLLLPAAVASRCDPRETECSSLINKVPAITDHVMPMDSQPAATASLSAEQRRRFEHMLGNSLRETPAVAWATREFVRRVHAFITGGAELNGTSADDALATAFISSKCDQSNTGWVGPSLPAIKRALESGNIRETWALMYVLTKTNYFTELMLSLLSPRPGDAPPIATPESLAARFGMSGSEIADRWELVKATKAVGNSDVEYAQGMPDFLYESFTSWVRFDFPSFDHAGRVLWRAARTYKASGCGAVSMRSDDPSIEPPLSAAELAYQCGSATSPCHLHWKPGALCYDLPNVSWVLPATSPTEPPRVVPGLNERAARLGYRSAAAASGTTANMLQLAALLGFSSDELVILRATMAAWMLPTDDHSFFEILLGADPYMPAAHQMVMGLDDLRVLWPPKATLRTTHGGAFSGVEVWSRVGARLATADGAELLNAMDGPSRRYVNSLVAACTEGEGAGAPALQQARVDNAKSPVSQGQMEE